MSVHKSFVYLYDHKGIAFIKEHYDIEHTLSLDDAVDDLALLFRQYENGMITFEKYGSRGYYRPFDMLCYRDISTSGRYRYQRLKASFP